MEATVKHEVVKTRDEGRCAQVPKAAGFVELPPPAKRNS